MQFKVGEKYMGSARDVVIEIRSFCSAAQVIQGDGLDIYEVMLDGFKVKLPEPVLAVLISEEVKKILKPIQEITPAVKIEIKVEEPQPVKIEPKKAVKKPVNKSVKSTKGAKK